MKNLILFLALSISFISGLEAKTLKVVSLSTITTEIAEKVGGDAVSVIGLVKPGQDPHEYSPTPGDLKAMSQADIVLGTGKGMDQGYINKIVSLNKNFVEVGNACYSLHMTEDGKNIEDPHWWNSVTCTRKVTKYIADQFAKTAPDEKKKFEVNANAYIKQLDELEKWVKETIDTLPKDKRKLVTSHDAFQYFAKDFGFSIYPIEGINPDEEPRAKKVAELIKTIREQKVKAIFFENIENPKLIQEITKETGAVVGGELYADGLGNEVDVSTYSGMMHHNIFTIVNALK
jgi:ABC-type Zn uptake system ZnuABC Zn-binding protein ZnuA